MLPSSIASWFERCRRLLRLDEFEIELRLDPELPVLGTCVADPTYPTAYIDLLDPSSGAHPDWKRTLLHELIHVRNGGSLGTASGSEERAALERGVEMMTRILYGLIEGDASERRIALTVDMCARTVEAAREGNGMAMDPGKLMDIGASLGALKAREDIPEDVKAELDKLQAALAEAVGAAPPAEETEPVIPDVEKPDTSTAAIGKNEAAFRAAMGDKAFEELKAEGERASRALLIQTARAKLGAALTPAHEKIIMSRSLNEGRAFVEGLCLAAPRPGTSKPDSTYRQAPAKQEAPLKAEDLVKPGEDPKTVSVDVLRVRARLLQNNMPVAGLARRSI